MVLDLATLSNDDRLAALRASGLLHKSQTERLDAAARTARYVLAADAAQVNMLDDHHQHHVGMDPRVEPVEDSGPVRESGCQVVVMVGDVVSIPDTTVHPVVCELPWTATWRAYLGIPVIYAGQVVGTVCVLSEQPRVWSDRDVTALLAVARLAGLSVRGDGSSVTADTSVLAR